jgi:hypothetical protein
MATDDVPMGSVGREIKWHGVLRLDAYPRRRNTVSMGIELIPNGAP